MSEIASPDSDFALVWFRAPTALDAKADSGFVALDRGRLWRLTPLGIPFVT
jgi:hypothetical protein